jgi:hypothetical protein
VVTTFQAGAESEPVAACNVSVVAEVDQETWRLVGQAAMLSETGCGTTETDTATGAETAVAPPLSVATAVSWQVSDTTLDHSNV